MPFAAEAEVFPIPFAAERRRQLRLCRLCCAERLRLSEEPGSLIPFLRLRLKNKRRSLARIHPGSLQRKGGAFPHIKAAEPRSNSSALIETQRTAIESLQARKDSRAESLNIIE